MSREHTDGMEDIKHRQPLRKPRIVPARRATLDTMQRRVVSSSMPAATVATYKVHTATKEPLAKNQAKTPLLPPAKTLQPPSLSLVAARAENTSKKSKKQRIKKPFFFNPKDSRLFLAGALCGVGLLLISVHFISFPFKVTGEDISPPIIAATSAVSPEESDGGDEDGIDQGINPRDIDPNPPIPITGSMPARLKIPSIAVNASIRSVGVTASGAMAVPNYLAQVGWYDQSAHPGKTGTTVLNGHYGGSIGPRHTVFRQLHQLKKGDILEVVRGDGKVVKYAVEKKESYHKKKVPMKKVVASDASDRLRIITCDGTWDNSSRSFSKRLIVYAKAV